MRNLDKYKGVIPAFYACYDEEGSISPEGVKALTRYFVEKGVKGVYVNGSSGECIYQSVEDKKTVLENVMEEAKGKLTVIAHVACPPRRERGSRRDRSHPAYIFPPAGTRDRAVLERHQLGGPKYGFCHLQYPAAGRRSPHDEFICRDEKKSECDRRQEFLYAGSGHPDV